MLGSKLFDIPSYVHVFAMNKILLNQVPESLLFAYALNTISGCSGSIIMNHVTDTFNHCLKFEMHFFIKFSHVEKLGEMGQ